MGSSVESEGGELGTIIAMNGHSGRTNQSTLSLPDPSWIEIEKSGVLDNAPSLSKTALAELRKLQGGFGIKSNNTPTALKTKDVKIKVSDEATISLRIYTPANFFGDLPTCVVYHGGGWTIGDLDTEDGNADRNGSDYKFSVAFCALKVPLL